MKITAGDIDKDGILEDGVKQAGNILFITTRVLKAENFIEGVYMVDGEVWKLSFTRIQQPNKTETV